MAPEIWKGRRLKRAGPAWIDDAAFARVNEAQYWQLVKAVAQDLFRSPNTAPALSLHERTFARFALVAMSPWGGCCWPEAGKDISRLTYAQAAHLAQPAQNQAAPYILFPRQGLFYPIFVAPVVQAAALLLVVQRMRVRPVRNRGLAALRPEDLLGPDSALIPAERQAAQVGYRQRLIGSYLGARARETGIEPGLALDEYLAMGRYAMTRIYDLDVLYATLDGFEPSVAQLEQLTDPDLWAALKQPFHPYPNA